MVGYEILSEEEQALHDKALWYRFMKLSRGAQVEVISSILNTPSLTSSLKLEPVGFAEDADTSERWRELTENMASRMAKHGLRDMLDEYFLFDDLPSKSKFIGVLESEIKKAEKPADLISLKAYLKRLARPGQTTLQEFDQTSKRPRNRL